jgi:MFS family permease
MTGFRVGSVLGLGWPVSPDPNRLAHAFRALKHRNFRLFVSGQLVSLSGTWMQQVALSWLVYRLTGSPFLLGAVQCAALSPVLLSPLAGVWADRVSRHKVVIATQVLAMLQAFALAALVFSDSIHIGYVIVLAGFLGCVNAAEVPARQSFLVEMVDGKEDLPSAIALNSSIFNASRLIGPSIAGGLVAWIGEGWVFFWNGVSYIAVLLALCVMRLAPAPRRADPTEPVLRTLATGLRYAFGFRPIRNVLLLLVGASLVGYPYVALLPVFARDILHGDARTLGYLLAAGGLGAVTALIALATRPNARGLGRIIAAAVVVVGVSLIGFSVIRSLAGALILSFVAGGAMMVHLAGSNTLLQTIVDDDKRGRVMSLFAMAHMGMVSVGALAVGTLASHLGAPTTVLIGGAGCLVLATLFVRGLPAMRAHIRPVYVRLGILSEGSRAVPSDCSK